MDNKLLLLLFLIIIIIFMLVINHNHNYIDIDTFVTPRSPKEINDNDGNMTFDFLTNAHTNSILSKYYINDDMKIDGVRVNYHPYQVKVPNLLPPIDTYSKYLQNLAFPYIYGNPKLHYQRTPGQWNKYDTIAQVIYNTTGVRR